MAVFVRQLMAARAFIEKLESLLINVKGAIFGGERFINVNDQVVDRGSNYTGFCIAQDGILKASGAEISGRIDAMLGRLQHISIQEHAVIEGDITIRSGEFQVVSDSEMERSYSNITALNLRTLIASDFNIPVSDIYSVSYGRFNLSPVVEFDTIIFTSNGGLFSLYKNASGITPQLNGLGTAEITIKIGSLQKVIIYDAPDSSTKKNVVYKTPDGNGNFFLKLKR